MRNIQLSKNVKLRNKWQFQITFCLHNLYLLQCLVITYKPFIRIENKQKHRNMSVIDLYIAHTIDRILHHLKFNHIGKRVNQICLYNGICHIYFANKDSKEKLLSINMYLIRQCD